MTAFGFQKKYSRGFSMAEIIVMVFVATLTIITVWRIYTFFFKISLETPSLFKASFLAEEGVEAVKFMRDGGWTLSIAPLASGASYTLVLEGGTWGVTTTPSYIDGQFDRRVSFLDVMRDASGNISESGALDQNTKKIVVSVSWQREGATTTKEIVTYVSNIFQN